MPIYEFASEEIRPLSKTTFGLMQLQERRDLQRLLRANIAVVAPDTLPKTEMKARRVFDQRGQRCCPTP